MSHAKSAAVTANGMVKANSSVKVKPDKNMSRRRIQDLGLKLSTLWTISGAVRTTLILFVKTN